jgi:Arc/MetJ family transcription regulator
MRTTVNLDPDVAAAVERLRRDRSMSLSEAVNELARAGLRERRGTREFRQRSQQIGLRRDVSDVPEALEQLEDPSDGRTRSELKRPPTGRAGSAPAG